MTERQRKAWKSSLNLLFGPPNWLVQEEWKRDSKGKPTEPFDAAMLRVRAGYGLSESPPVPRTVEEAREWYTEKMSKPGAYNERERRIKAALDKDEQLRQNVRAPEMSEVIPDSMSKDDVQPKELSKVCLDCGKIIDHVGARCYACQKRRQRG